MTLAIILPGVRHDGASSHENGFLAVVRIMAWRTTLDIRPQSRHNLPDQQPSPRTRAHTLFKGKTDADTHTVSRFDHRHARIGLDGGVCPCWPQQFPVCG
jgi:hypothetical protein